MYRSELLKLRTTRAAWIIAAVAWIGMIGVQGLTLALPRLVTSLGSGTSDLPPEVAAELVPDLATLTDLGSPALQRSLLDLLALGPGSSSVGLTVMAVLVLGALVATTDLRTGGIVPTALITPSRPRILAAKAAAGATVAGIVGVGLVVLTALGLFLAVTITPGAELALSPGEVLGIWGRGLAVLVLFTWLGQAIGTLIRGQVATLITVGALIVAEPILRGIVSFIGGGGPAVTDWLPLGLGSLASVGPGAGMLAGPAGLGALGGLVALGAWVLVLGFGALETFRRRDLA
ncbi:hypothetical protein EXU48_01240 [Occultella glacieicola]|uniref:ABC transporter permease n=1 Tax=Occultella glacieicola TaxID=2518684 RepID=A0ABY2E8M4_9MICO|nr:hypothetical protein [Occultella glacieicola]TDE98854.1 hypothetical protein EXU48_01240 [Occultella glacieicola]